MYVGVSASLLHQSYICDGVGGRVRRRNVCWLSFPRLLSKTCKTKLQKLLFYTTLELVLSS
jgi:hypothetical protein